MPAPSALDPLPPDLRAGRRSLQPLTPERYALGHAAFEARSTQRGLIADWLVRRLGASGARSVLSVGCGDGTLDEQVCRRLGRALTVDGLEPHLPSAVGFLQRVGRVEGVRAGVRVGVVDDLAGDRRYDAVLAVHCLYYPADLASVLTRLTSLLTPGGELLVLLAPVGELNRLASSLAPDSGGHRQWWSDDLAAALAAAGLTGRREQLDAQVQLEDCLDAEDGEGAAVLDFVVQAVLPEQLRTAVLDHLVAVRRAGPGLRVDHPVDAWVVAAP